jgi:hypothetical protein
MKPRPYMPIAAYVLPNGRFIPRSDPAWTSDAQPLAGFDPQGGGTLLCVSDADAARLGLAPELVKRYGTALTSTDAVHKERLKLYPDTPVAEFLEFQHALLWACEDARLRAQVHDPARQRRKQDRFAEASRAKAAAAAALLAQLADGAPDVLRPLLKLASIRARPLSSRGDVRITPEGFRDLMSALGKELKTAPAFGRNLLHSRKDGNLLRSRPLYEADKFRKPLDPATALMFELEIGFRHFTKGGQAERPSPGRWPPLMPAGGRPFHRLVAMFAGVALDRQIDEGQAKEAVRDLLKRDPAAMNVGSLGSKV